MKTTASVKLLSSTQHLSRQESSEICPTAVDTTPVTTTSVQATDEGAPPVDSIASSPKDASNIAKLQTLEASAQIPVAESLQACQDTPIEPNADGSYGAYKVKVASPPSGHHFNADKVITPPTVT